MTNILRFPNLSLGELEVEVLDILWRHGALAPQGVYDHVSNKDSITSKTVASALKRLFEKGLLHRDKVSHAFEYRPAVKRSELQRQLIGTITEHFDNTDNPSFLAAFVDLAEAHGEDTLRQLEEMIAQRLQDKEDA